MQRYTTEKFSYCVIRCFNASKCRTCLQLQTNIVQTQIDGMPRCHTVTDISSVCFYETAAAQCATVGHFNF